MIIVFALLIPSESPFPKHIQPIKYPELARLAHWEGTVAAHIELDQDGRVAQLSAKGRPILVDAVQAPIKSWTFYVTGKNTINIDIQFKLLGKPRWPANAETFVTYDLPDKVTVVTQPPVCDHCPDSRHDSQ